MCGIAGIVAKNSTRLQQLIEAMIESLTHRGPDGRGIHCFSDCVLGHTRLSIIDPIGGSQPMLNQARSMGVTFNGELYGFRDLRCGLRNFTFTTESDTELLLALYEQFGERMLDKLPGMFAFAIWDEHHKRLFAARDRFGEKPFYYAFGKDGELVFASEIKAIVKSGLIDPRIDKQSLAYYLRRGFVPPDRSIYKNLHCLPPGHALLSSPEKFYIWRYWTPPRPERKIEWDEAVEQFRYLFRRAVRQQLVADVPVAAFLSGGLDSSTVVVEACRGMPKLVTMSFGFPGNFDERPFARELARLYKTEHVELASHDVDLEGAILQMPLIYDEPFSDSSSIPTFLLCREASKLFKVVLTGDGGDELLAGYPWYASLLAFERGRNTHFVNYAAHRLMLAVLDRMSSRRLPWLGEHSRGIVEGYSADSINSCLRSRQSMFSSEQIRSMGLSPDPPVEYRSQTALDAAMENDVAEYLPGDILVKIDRAAMANSLELRAPFLDVELAEFCLSLPHQLKLSRFADKLILRRSYHNQWPAMIRNRRKQGFGAPLRAWLKDPSIANLVQENVTARSSPLFDMIDYQGFRSIPIRSVHQTWALLSLALWSATRPGAANAQLRCKLRQDVRQEPNPN